jgi:hypothetical protein
MNIQKNPAVTSRIKSFSKAGHLYPPSPFAFGNDILITLGAVVTAPNKMIILKFSSTLRSFLQFALLVFLLLSFLCFFE